MCRFLSTLTHERHLSERTVAMYALALDELHQSAGGAKFEQLTSADIRRGLVHLQSKQQAPRSIALALSAWRGYYRWLVKSGVMSANPTQGLRAPRPARPLPKALSPDETGQLLQFEATDAIGARDLAMFELFYSSGLRLGELVGLNILPGEGALGWLAEDKREVTVTGKGNKRRTVPVGHTAAQALAHWESKRHELARADESALFVGKRGQRIHPSVVQVRLRITGIRQGVLNKVHPHMLRHSFASHVLQSSGDLRAVQEMLGHASITATQVYTNLDFQHLSKVYDVTHPRAKKR